jgi:hypothetical protein
MRKATKANMKAQGTKSSPLLVVARFSALKLPTRSGPRQFYQEFAAVALKIPEGGAVEINSDMVDEHRCRKYLALLASQDPNYRRLTLRTAAGSDRRRVFIVNAGSSEILLPTSQEGPNRNTALEVQP